MGKKCQKLSKNAFFLNEFVLTYLSLFCAGFIFIAYDCWHNFFSLITVQSILLMMAGVMSGFAHKYNSVRLAWIQLADYVTAYYIEQQFPNGDIDLLGWIKLILILVLAAEHIFFVVARTLTEREEARSSSSD